MKLDIACGSAKTPGFKGIDLIPEADIVHDLFDAPWPVKANTVTEVVCNHFLEHVPHYRPQWEGVDGWWVFWGEIYRICKDGATVTMRHPYVWNNRAFQDPTHVRFIHESNYWYLHRESRKAMNVDHYAADVNFDTVTVNFQQPAEIAARADGAKAFAQTYYVNSISDLEVILACRKSS